MWVGAVLNTHTQGIYFILFALRVCSQCTLTLTLLADTLSSVTVTRDTVTQTDTWTLLLLHTVGWLGWLAYDIYLAVDWSIDSLDPLVSNRTHVVHCNTDFVYIQDHLRTALFPIQECLSSEVFMRS